MWGSKYILFGTDILFAIFAVYLFCCYFDIFFCRKRRVLSITGSIIFIMWQIAIVNINFFPIYINSSITIAVTLIVSVIVYKGRLWKKCIFTITFNAVWMLIETLSSGILFIYCSQIADSDLFGILGAFVSKIIFWFFIIALKKFFMDDEVKELPLKYSIMLVLIPTGSIYIMNNIFILNHKLKNNYTNFHSAISAMILLGMDILIFYIYIKLAEDLRLRRMTAVYERQLELCERNQEETEMSTVQLRDIRHNMKNNLISILGYAENGECEKIINFVNEVMEQGGIKTSAISNSGNVVIDSLIGYWFFKAQKYGIDFSTDICIPMNIPFKGADVCLILGNLLENAVEAACRGGDRKYIQLRIKYDKNNLLIFLKNNYRGQLIKTKDSRLKSTKSDVKNHGIGLSSIYRVTEKYHGTVVIDDSQPECFAIRVVLYGE